MNTIKSFNHRLNQSIISEQLAFSKFRSNVDKRLKTHIVKLNDAKRVCIIGAGNLSDFSLSLFCMNFDEILITDVDIESSKEVVKKIQKKNKCQKNIIFKEVEYTGFNKAKFFTDFSREITRCISFDEIDRYIKTKIKMITEYTFLSDYENYFDLVYVSPIYTQLIYQQLLLECSKLREKGFQENFLKYIEHEMLDEMIDVIKRFNTNIMKLVSKDGTLVVLSDILQLDNQSDYKKSIEEKINDYPKMEEEYRRYSNKYGMGLGDFGLYNLDMQMQIKDSVWLLWPFNKDTSFAVKMKVYEKKILKEVFL